MTETKAASIWNEVIEGMNLPSITDLIEHLTVLGLKIDFNPLDSYEDGLAMCELAVEAPTVYYWQPFGTIPQAAAQGLLWGFELQLNGLAPVKSDLISYHLLAQREQKHAD